MRADAGSPGSGRALERDLAEADCFGGDQNALGIHAVQDVLEATAFFADPVGDGDFEAVDEDLVGIDGLAPHFGDLVRLHELAVEIRIEEAQAL